MTAISHHNLIYFSSMELKPDSRPVLCFFLGLEDEQAKLEINKAKDLKQECRETYSLPLHEECMTSKLFSNEHRMRALHLLLISLTDIHLNLKRFSGSGQG